jgi:hypothetical protein
VCVKRFRTLLIPFEGGLHWLVNSAEQVEHVDFGDEVSQWSVDVEKTIDYAGILAKPFRKCSANGIIEQGPSHHGCYPIGTRAVEIISTMPRVCASLNMAHVMLVAH